MNHNRNVFTAKENVRILSIIVLICISFYESDFQYISLIWGILLLIQGNVKRISRNRWYLYWLRMTLYFLPYSFPCLIFCKTWSSDVYGLVWGGFAALLTFHIWYLISRKKIKVMLSNQMILDCYKDSFFVLSMKIYNLIGAAICEELFFRFYILTRDSPLMILFLISVVYFILCHYLLPWSEDFSFYDYINQLVIGTANAVIFIIFDSVLPCIFLHLLVNSISIQKYIKIIDRYYLRPRKYEALLDNNLFDGIEI